MLTQIIAGISVALAPQFELQVTLRFITAAACSNMFTSGYIICTDITGGRWKVITGACYEHMWSLGVVTLAALGYLLRNWSQLQLAISVPTIFVLVTNVWIPDSPRWLISKGRGAEAKQILQQGAKFNGRNTSVPDIPTPSIERKKTETKWVELFDKPGNRWNCLAMHVIWAVTIVTYYGALLNVKNVGEHLYFNTMIAGFAEVAGVLLGLALMLWCRRKWTALGIILVVGGGACVASWLQPSQEEWPREWVMLSLAMAGRVAIATSLTLLQVTSSELFPEHHRQMGIFSCITVARVFLLSAPFIGSLAMYGDCVSLSSFGGITVIGGLAVLFLGKSQCKSSQSRDNIQNVWSTEKFNQLNRSKVVELPEQNFGKFNRNVDQGV